MGHKTKLNICHHMLTSSTQLQNWSFHVVERTRTSTKCQKLKYARAKRAKILFFIVKYANLWGFCCLRRRGCLSSLLAGEGKVSPWFNSLFAQLCQLISAFGWNCKVHCLPQTWKTLPSHTSISSVCCFQTLSSTSSFSPKLTQCKIYWKSPFLALSPKFQDVRLRLIEPNKFTTQMRRS